MSYIYTYTFIKNNAVEKMVPTDLLNTGLPQAFHLWTRTTCEAQEDKVRLYPKWEPSQPSKIQKLQTGLGKSKDEAKTAQNQKIQQTELSFPSSQHRLIQVVSKSRFVTMAQTGCEWKCDEDGETRWNAKPV